MVQLENEPLKPYYQFHWLKDAAASRVKTFDFRLAKGTIKSVQMAFENGDVVQSSRWSAWRKSGAAAYSYIELDASLPGRVSGRVSTPGGGRFSPYDGADPKRRRRLQVAVAGMMSAPGSA